MEVKNRKKFQRNEVQDKLHSNSEKDFIAPYIQGTSKIYAIFHYKCKPPTSSCMYIKTA